MISTQHSGWGQHLIPENRVSIPVFVRRGRQRHQTAAVVHRAIGGYLAFRQLPIALALLSMVPVQAGVNSETRLMAEGLLAMLGGASGVIQERESLNTLEAVLLDSSLI